jgi:hypothetical protein
VLVANTGGDRLIDWNGEFNTYLVPFAPFGMATVSRTLQPHLMDFLYALSAADGGRSDSRRRQGGRRRRSGAQRRAVGRTRPRAATRRRVGRPARRAGRSAGRQHPGRAARRAALGELRQRHGQGFVPATGTWRVVNGRYQVAPPTGGGDAISLFNQADTVIPSYFEMQATINALKPVSGTKANAFLIFDYQVRPTSSTPASTSR